MSPKAEGGFVEVPRALARGRLQILPRLEGTCILTGVDKTPSHLMSHQPPHIQHDPASNRNLRRMTCSPLILVRIEPSRSGRVLEPRQLRGEVNAQRGGALKQITPGQHLYLVTDEEVWVPVVHQLHKARDRLRLFVHRNDLDIVI